MFPMSRCCSNIRGSSLLKTHVDRLLGFDPTKKIFSSENRLLDKMAGLRRSSLEFLLDRAAKKDHASFKTPSVSERLWVELHFFHQTGDLLQCKPCEHDPPSSIQCKEV